jgi:hypothetical protein
MNLLESAPSHFTVLMANRRFHQHFGTISSYIYTKRLQISELVCDSWQQDTLSG